MLQILCYVLGTYKSSQLSRVDNLEERQTNKFLQHKHFWYHRGPQAL